MMSIHEDKKPSEEENKDKKPKNFSNGVIFLYLPLHHLKYIISLIYHQMMDMLIIERSTSGLSK